MVLDKLRHVGQVVRDQFEGIGRGDVVKVVISLHAEVGRRRCHPVDAHDVHDEHHLQKVLLPHAVRVPPVAMSKRGLDMRRRCVHW